jgi:uncharacterized RDD family membrane protein YckC
MLFSGMTLLNELYLYNNDFTELDGGTFAEVAATLTVLNLGGNKLSELDATLFSGMTSLQTLRLDDNDLTELDGGSFTDLAATLTYLNLDGNKLSELNTTLFAGMSSLKKLRLNDNIFITRWAFSLKPVRFRGQLLRIGTMWTDKLEGGHGKSIFLSRFNSSITVTRDYPPQFTRFGR